MSSRATGAPNGRLATPHTKQPGFRSFPKTSCNNSEAPSATFDWLPTSPEVATAFRTAWEFIANSFPAGVRYWLRVSYWAGCHDAITTESRSPNNWTKVSAILLYQPRDARPSSDGCPFWRRTSSAKLAHVITEPILDISWLMKAAFHQPLNTLLRRRTSQRIEKGSPFR